MERGGCASCGLRGVARCEVSSRSADRRIAEARDAAGMLALDYTGRVVNVDGAFRGPGCCRTRSWMIGAAFNARGGRFQCQSAHDALQWPVVRQLRRNTQHGDRQWCSDEGQLPSTVVASRSAVAKAARRWCGRATGASADLWLASRAAANEEREVKEAASTVISRALQLPAHGCCQRSRP